MNLYNFFLIFLFLLEILFLMGYSYSNSLNIVFSIPFVFDEEFVIMFAMFIVTFLLIFYTIKSFSIFFEERIITLNKYFLDIFDVILNNQNNLISNINKLYSFFQHNYIVLKISIENNLFILIELEKRQIKILNDFNKLCHLRDKFFFSYSQLLKKKP